QRSRAAHPDVGRDGARRVAAPGYRAAGRAAPALALVSVAVAGGAGLSLVPVGCSAAGGRAARLSLGARRMVSQPSVGGAASISAGAVAAVAIAVQADGA